METKKSEIKIIEVKPPKEYKPGKFIYLMKSGELHFQTFDTQIGQAFVVGFEGQAEYVEKEDEFGFKRTINQMWDKSGNAIREMKKGKYSPEQQRDYALTEASKQICSLMCAGAIDLIPSDVRDDYWNRIRSLYRGTKTPVKSDEVFEQMKREDNILVVDMPDIARYKKVMNAEFKFNDTESTKLLAEVSRGRTVGPVIFKEAYLKALADRKAK